MGTLYIIGNGLDLHFNLDTTMRTFREHLDGNSLDGKEDSALDVLDDYGVDWHEYEQSLNNMNLDIIQSENKGDIPSSCVITEDSEPGSHEKCAVAMAENVANMQDHVDDLGDSIRDALESMISAANKDAKQQGRTAKSIKLFTEGDAILSFNYTSTLDYLFDIPDSVEILHIHGKHAFDDELVFGYKRTDDSYSLDWVTENNDDINNNNKDSKGNKNSTNNSNNNDKPFWDGYAEQQREIVYIFYDDWRKKIRSDELEDFLSRCEDIGTVVVLGHSMSEGDSEYMEKIERRLHPNRWKVSYFFEEDIDTVMRIGYSFERKIEFFPIEELLYKN